jgi:YegS/Rv2252/BmrU family lipid kinase
MGPANAGRYREWARLKPGTTDKQAPVSAGRRVITVIINPLSGSRGRRDLGVRRAALAKRLLAAHRLDDTRVFVTEYPGHAIVLAREAVSAGSSLVCAWGGDGTLNEVATALVHSNVVLGVIRAGSGNGFARELGIPAGAQEALEVALHGRDRVIDAGEVGGRLFFNVAGIGLDAHIAALFNTRAPHLRGFWRYVTLGWRELMTYRCQRYRLDADGERLDTEAFMVVLANLRQYGSGAYIAPQAEPDDGRLDLVVVEARSTMRAFLLTPRLFAGNLHRARGILTRRVTRISISSDAVLLCHVDGETFEAGTEVTAVVKPKALRVRVRK